MNLWLLVGSLAGVLALAGVAWLLGLGGATIADADEAIRIAEAEVPGFVATSAEVGDDGQSALVSGPAGGVVRLRRHGAHFVAER